MRPSLRAALLTVPLLLPVGLAAAPPPAGAAREESARLAVAVLGRVCLMTLGDPSAAQAATAPGGEFGFVEAPADVAKALLGERAGTVRVLRRPGLGAIAVVIGTDGGCAVAAETADGAALRRDLDLMIAKGGMKGGLFLQPMGISAQDGVQITDFALIPTGWYARQLGARLGGDGTQAVLLVTAVAPPGLRPMEAVLTVRPPVPAAPAPPAAK